MAELNNRVAFIDFVRGLLNINPLERWSPQQAKLHPFITQQKFTQPFVPPMNVKSPTTTKSPAPGVQQQQQAEAVSKQRAAQAAQAAQAQAQAQAHAQAQAQAQSAYAMQLNHYQQQQQQQQQQHQTQIPPIYTSMYAAQQTGPPPAYGAPNPGHGNQIGNAGQGPSQMQPAHLSAQQSLYAQATTRAGRQRASTMDQQQGGIPASIQRVASHLDPNAPIRLQPSPAYYPPPPDGYMDTSAGSRRRTGGGHRSRDFIRTLEDGAMGDGFMTNKTQWH